jgi:mono/diheme cytochrome c family protein
VELILQADSCMKQQPGFTLALASFVFIALHCSHAQVPLPAPPPAISSNSAALVARGEFILRDAAVCGGCHSASEHDPDGPLSGGREFHDWRIGTARASNLTPDNETGLGTWSEAEIVRALRNGQSKDGRLLAPVMPYEWLHEMSDDDAFAVAHYLKSLPPVRNEVLQSPSIWFKLGKLFGPKPGQSIIAPPAGATAQYGGYLSQHVGLCAECHTPRGGIRSTADMSRLFAGAANPPTGFPANPSNLTPDPTGIAKWSEADFIQTIRTGVNPSGNHLHPFMPWHQNRRMSDDDLRAIYRFLRTVPPITSQVPRRQSPAA